MISITIYCVEDDPSVRDLMVYTLNLSGYKTQGFSSADTFWPALKASKPDLIILDVMLPGEDGLSILKHLRASSSTSEIPVIMATAKDSEYDTVIGLDLGADDYLSKPFGMMEMISRVKAVLRRAPSNKPELITNGIISIDEDKHIVCVEGKQVLLTLKEYQLLHILLTHPGRVFTRETLLSRVWGMDFAGETRTVDVHIGTLRTKLLQAGSLIKTVRGVGYKMRAVDE